MSAVDILCKGRWAGHESGQFACHPARGRGAAPYTISSAWTGIGHITFIIKARRLHPHAERARMSATSSSWRGRTAGSLFQGAQKRQILGVLDWHHAVHLAHEGAGCSVRWQGHRPAPPYGGADEHAIGSMARDAEAAGVHLHVLWSQRDGQLNAARLTELAPGWRDADIWFWPRALRPVAEEYPWGPGTARVPLPSRVVSDAVVRLGGRGCGRARLAVLVRLPLPAPAQSAPAWP